MAIVIIFYLTYDLETSRSLVLLGPPEIEKLSPQEYKAYNYFGFLSGITIVFLAITFFILPCLLQAYLFKCHSTGEKCKKLSWFIGFVCNILLIASVYVYKFYLHLRFFCPPPKNKLKNKTINF